MALSMKVCWDNKHMILYVVYVALSAKPLWLITYDLCPKFYIVSLGIQYCLCGRVWLFTFMVSSVYILIVTCQINSMIRYDTSEVNLI